MTAPRGLQTADPGASYRAAAGEIQEAIRRVLESGHYILGPEVEAFEREFAAYLGAAQAVTVANGTDAVELALRAAGVHPGDRVLTVANTATATVAAIELSGARAEFVDIDPRTMTMDPEALAQQLALLLWILFAHGIYAVPAPTVPVLPLVLVGVGALLLANIIAALPGRYASRTPTALVLRAESAHREPNHRSWCRPLGPDGG